MHLQVVLPFIVQGNRLSATVPANATIAPPGFYMLFLVRCSLHKAAEPALSSCLCRPAFLGNLSACLQLLRRLQVSCRLHGSRMLS